MTTRFNNWKRWFLIPFLCILLALAGGCGGTGSSDSGDRQDRQELQKIEAAAENPASGEFDDLQETDADEGQRGGFRKRRDRGERCIHHQG